MMMDDFNLIRSTIAKCMLDGLSSVFDIETRFSVEREHFMKKFE
jgi:hypothetical protein